MLRSYWSKWSAPLILQTIPVLSLIVAGGHMKPDPYNSISRLAAEHGLEAASEVAAFEASHVTAIKDLVDEEGIDCDYVVTSAMDVQLSPAHCEAMKTNYDRLVARGCRPTTETEFVDKQDAEQVRTLLLPIDVN